MKRLALILAALLAGPAFAQTQPVGRYLDPSGGPGFPTCASPTDGVMVIALDPVDATDCDDSGGGGGTAAPHPCVCDGGATTWNAISGGVSDHGGLTGLTDDDHPGHPWGAGRAGGQTLTGGTAASESLTLQSTAHATKGKILFGTSAYDEANTRLGIGTASPGEAQELRSTGFTQTRYSSSADAQTWDFGLASNFHFQLRDETAGSTVFIIEKGSPATSFRISTSGFALFGNGSFGSGAGVVSLANATTVPSTNPAGGAILYSSPVATNKSNLFARNEEGHVAQLSGVDVAAGSDFVKDNTSMANVPGLSFQVEAGKTYSFTARLYFDANATGGHKWTLNTNGTASSAIIHIRSLCDSTGAYVITSRVTSFGSTAGQAGCTAGYTEITATATFSAAGLVWVSFAQNTASGQSFVKRGSSFHRRVVAPGTT